MENINKISILESQIINCVNQGINTIEAISDFFSGSEKSLHQTIYDLEEKNVIKLEKGKYVFQKELSGNIVLLDGDMLLPVTIIERGEFKYVNRGIWYKFKKDFDIRRIVWNLKLSTKDVKNQSLVDLIRTSVLKEKKSKIEQLPEYTNLVNKIVPYNSQIGLFINAVGEKATDVSILFKVKLGDSDLCFEHKGFTVRTEISTPELIEELSKPIDKRKYDNIKLNRIYNFEDFVFSKNEIPFIVDLNKIEYAKITGIKKEIELTFYRVDNSGSTKKLNVETYEIGDGLDRIYELYLKYAKNMLALQGFITEDKEN